MKDFQFAISPEQHEQMIRSYLFTELEFVSAFIDQQNGQLIKFTGEFDCEDEASKAHGFSYDSERENLKVSGLSNYEYDLNVVFKEELPEYIKQSQLVILWAMLERSLGVIITELYRLRDLHLPKKKKHESYFIHLVKCLKTIDGDNQSIENVVSFLNDNVRVVRNYIVHSGEINVTHRWLYIENGSLKIHREYISEVIFSISYLANNI